MRYERCYELFNSKLKKEWLSRLEGIQKEYAEEMSDTQESIINLFETRKDAVEQIKQVESFINTIANTPKEFNATLQQVTVKLQDFKNTLSLKEESELTTKISGSIAGAGALAGSGIAVLGPTAAMAIATTFGTASTGTAIASLSGAAASNAALAWLGGGALVAGGGGMSAGSAFLALAGPVGWAIGGVACLSGTIYASSKNKKIAEEAEENVYKIKAQINYIIKTNAEVMATQKLTMEHDASLNQELSRVIELVRQSNPRVGFFDRIKNFLSSRFSNKVTVYEASQKKSYAYFDNDLKKELGALVNNTLSLAKLIEKKLV